MPKSEGRPATVRRLVRVSRESDAIARGIGEELGVPSALVLGIVVGFQICRWTEPNLTNFAVVLRVAEEYRLNATVVAAVLSLWRTRRAGTRASVVTA